jgi:hypothetical protein
VSDEEKFRLEEEAINKIKGMLGEHTAVGELHGSRCLVCHGAGVLDRVCNRDALLGSRWQCWGRSSVHQNIHGCFAAADVMHNPKWASISQHVLALPALLISFFAAQAPPSLTLLNAPGVSLPLLPLCTAAEVEALWREYEGQATPASHLVKDFDKLEMILQAAEYEGAQVSPRVLWASVWRVSWCVGAECDAGRSAQTLHLV